MSLFRHFFGKTAKAACHCCLCEAPLAPAAGAHPGSYWVCEFCATQPVKNTKDVDKLYGQLSRFFSERMELDLSSWLKVKDIVLSGNQTLYSPERDIIAQGRAHFVERSIPFLGYRQIVRKRVHLLKGLPFIAAGGVLAHEAFHVYSAMCGYQLNEVQEEGSANLVNYLFLRRHPGQLSALCCDALMDSMDPIYGEGFKIAREKYKEVGGFQKYLRAVVA